MTGSEHTRTCQDKGPHLLQPSLINFVNLTETPFLFVSQRTRVFICLVWDFFVGEGSERWRGHH